jgi:hypothetical protein
VGCPETLRNIMAYNSQCAHCSTPSRRILRNETGSYPGGQHCAQYRVQGLSGAKLDDDATPVSRTLNIAHNTLPQVFARMGLLPLDGKPLMKNPRSGARRSAALGPNPTLTLVANSPREGTAQIAVKIYSKPSRYVCESRPECLFYRVCRL